jgi:hypothetical protein
MLHIVPAYPKAVTDLPIWPSRVIRTLGGCI